MISLSFFQLENIRTQFAFQGGLIRFQVAKSDDHQSDWVIEFKGPERGGLPGIYCESFLLAKVFLPVPGLLFRK